MGTGLKLGFYHTRLDEGSMETMERFDRKQSNWLGCNPKTGTIDAPFEFWEERIKENPKYEKLQEKGIRKELFDKYELLFNNVARGDHAYSPSVGQLPKEIDTIEVDKVVGEDTWNRI
ncbi:hypothetical protein SLA2020_207210 [Shorea laevis]